MDAQTTGVITAVATVLGKAIHSVWVRIISKHDETEQRLTSKLERCEEQHAQANERILLLTAESNESILKLTGRVERVEGFMEGRESMMREERGDSASPA